MTHLCGFQTHMETVLPGLGPGPAAPTTTAPSTSCKLSISSRSPCKLRCLVKSPSSPPAPHPPCTPPLPSINPSAGATVGAKGETVEVNCPSVFEVLSSPLLSSPATGLRRKAVKGERHTGHNSSREKQLLQTQRWRLPQILKSQCPGAFTA